MTDPFVSEIRVFPFNFAPVGWAKCDGQLLPISQNTALFSLLGTTYGGDGKSTFALPDLQGRFPIQHGQGPGLSDYFAGQTGGSATVTLLESEIPSHSHQARAVDGEGTETSAEGNAWATPRYGRATEDTYSASATVPMSPSALAAAGGGQPHNNMPPYLTLTFCIAMQGIFPARP